MTRFPTVDELIYINEALPDNDRIHKILKGKQKVRDMGLLEASAARPQQSVFGQDAYPELEDKAAALLHSVARNHPFADDNKRTATIAALFLLAINGRRVTWEPEDALAQVVELAEGRLDAATFAVWLHTEPADAHPEPDAEADAQLIASLITTHRWLLDELAKR